MRSRTAAASTEPTTSWTACWPRWTASGRNTSVRLNELAERIREDGVREIILATNPNVQGDQMAPPIMKLVRGMELRVSRIAPGVPVGGDLKYTDRMTLAKSIEFRRGRDRMPSCRDISARIIAETVRALFVKANIEIGQDVLSLLARAVKTETSERGIHVLEQILENARIACEDRLPLCQDTGLAIVFIELGQDVHVTDGDFSEAVQEGVRQAYRDGFLRKSLCDPLDRCNTATTPLQSFIPRLYPAARSESGSCPRAGL